MEKLSQIGGHVLLREKDLQGGVTIRLILAHAEASRRYLSTIEPSGQELGIAFGGHATLMANETRK